MSCESPTYESGGRFTYIHYAAVMKYQKQILVSSLDRIGTYIEILRVEYEKLIVVLEKCYYNVE